MLISLSCVSDGNIPPESWLNFKLIETEGTIGNATTAEKKLNFHSYWCWNFCKIREIYYENDTHVFPSGMTQIEHYNIHHTHNSELKQQTIKGFSLLPSSTSSFSNSGLFQYRNILNTPFLNLDKYCTPLKCHSIMILEPPVH